MRSLSFFGMAPEQGGEFALEYLKRISPRWRAAHLEGEGEDLSIGQRLWPAYTANPGLAPFSIACAERLASDALIEGQVLAAQPDAE